MSHSDHHLWEVADRSYKMTKKKKKKIFLLRWNVILAQLRVSLWPSWCLAVFWCLQWMVWAGCRGDSVHSISGWSRHSHRAGSAYPSAWPPHRPWSPEERNTPSRLVEKLPEHSWGTALRQEEERNLH